MKNILNIVLLLPLLIYALLLLANSDLLSNTAEINLFFTSFSIPVVGFITLFFVLYLLLIYSLFKFSNFFVTHKNKTLTDEMNALKASLHDREPQFLQAIEEKFEAIIAKNNLEHKEHINTLKKENEKIITNLNYDIKTMKEKVEKLGK